MSGRSSRQRQSRVVFARSLDHDRSRNSTAHKSLGRSSFVSSYIKSKQSENIFELHWDLIGNDTPARVIEEIWDRYEADKDGEMSEHELVDLCWDFLQCVPELNDIRDDLQVIDFDQILRDFAKQIAHIVFTMMDTDGSGFIDAAEFAVTFRELFGLTEALTLAEIKNEQKLNVSEIIHGLTLGVLDQKELLRSFLRRYNLYTYLGTYEQFKQRSLRVGFQKPHFSRTETEKKMLHKLLSPVFEQFRVPEDRHAILMYKFALLEVQPGTYIFKEGDVAEYFYIILTGKVSLEKERNGSIETLRSLRAGDYFGEATFLYNDKGRFGSVVADEFTQLAILDGRYVQTYLLPFFRQNLEKKDKFFKSLPIFHGIPEDVVHQVAYIAKKEEFEHDTVVTQQGDELDPHVYFIYSGNVRVIRECELKELPNFKVDESLLRYTEKRKLRWRSIDAQMEKSKALESERFDSSLKPNLTQVLSPREVKSVIDSLEHTTPYDIADSLNNRLEEQFEHRSSRGSLATQLITPPLTSHASRYQPLGARSAFFQMGVLGRSQIFGESLSYGLLARRKARMLSNHYSVISLMKCTTYRVSMTELFKILRDEHIRILTDRNDDHTIPRYSEEFIDEMLSRGNKWRSFKLKLIKDHFASLGKLDKFYTGHCKTFAYV